jgi:N-acetylglutamate synthase-like GNAT family acetyltransferase
MSYLIRKAEQNDLDRLAQIYINAYAGEPWFETWQFEKAKERIAEVLLSSKSLCFIYEENSIIMGCSLCMIMTWHTGLQLEGKELFVDPQYQKKGIAGKLVHYVESMTADLGITEFFFWTMRNKYRNNPDKLFNYYKKMGYDIAEERIVMIKKFI